MLFGFTNAMSNIPGFLTPLLVSVMTAQSTLDQWYNIFTLAGVIYIIGGLVYIIWGSSETQEWAKCSSQQEKKVNVKV